MADKTERFQAAIAEHGEGSVAVLVDSATGRTWWCRPGARGGPVWQPIGFAEAPAAPAPSAPPRRRRRSRA